MTKIEATTEAENLEKLIATLTRQVEIPALECLAQSLKGGIEAPSITNSAIVLDANALLRIPANERSADIIDYLTTMHKSPLVIPGQVIQEFWNNQINAMDTVHKVVAKRYSEFSKEVEQYEKAGISGADSLIHALDSFKTDNEHIFVPDLLIRTSNFLDNIATKASVPFAPREHFHSIAAIRKRTRTPPGFKDENFGDFFVWVDLLWGLMQTKGTDRSFESVILVTNDSKIDWSRGNVPHPILSAELNALLGVNLSIWTLDQFVKAIGQI